MSTYIALMKWTDEGAKDAKQTVNRAEQFTKVLEGMGGQLRGIYWTQGEYDLVGIADLPDEDTLTAFMMQLATSGLVHTETMRAFSADDMRRIIGKLG